VEVATLSALVAVLEFAVSGLKKSNSKSLSAEQVAAVSAIVGHSFKNVQLLSSALTHGSSGNKLTDYQRLEFLGDRVLGLVTAHSLFDQHSSETEGQMATRHSALVNGERCADIADALGLSDYIIVGASERAKGVQRTRSILGDVMEALIGALYLDGGLEVARAFILRSWNDQLSATHVVRKDPKTFLQEWALARALPLPRYEVLSRSGPEHRPEFVVGIQVGAYPVCEGLGPSKQLAEMASARNFLQREGLDD
jgi:ribonuclease III